MHWGDWSAFCDREEVGPNEQEPMKRNRIEPTLNGTPGAVPQQTEPAEVVETAQKKPTLLPHEIIARGFRALGYAGFVGWTMILLAIGIPIIDSGASMTPDLLVFPLFAFFVVTLLFVAADGLTRGRWWGRPLGLAYAFVIFFGFPVGTVISLNIVWHLLLNWEKSADHFAQHRRAGYSHSRSPLRDAA